MSGRVDLWRLIYERGDASELCDGIVRDQDPPVELLRAVNAAPPVYRFPKTVERPGMPLSPGELMTLQHLAEGLENKEVAVREQVGVETVRTRVRVVLNKLEARNRTDAVLKGLALGLVVNPYEPEAP